MPGGARGAARRLLCSVSLRRIGGVRHGTARARRHCGSRHGNRRRRRLLDAAMDAIARAGPVVAAATRALHLPLSGQLMAVLRSTAGTQALAPVPRNTTVSCL